MHEVGIMQSALQMALETATSSGGERIHCLRLRVGAMSGVVPEALEFAFEIVCRGTIAEGARLEIESVAPRLWCSQCEAEFDCADYNYECPRCHEPGAELRRGRELEIASVEIS